MDESVLIVEDDATFGATLQRALKRRGHPAFTAGTAEAALALARGQRPKWIVLDLNLGGVSGLALIPALRHVLPAARIVVLTGYASISTAVDAIKLGAVQYLAKPVDVDTLVRAFHHAPAEGAADTAAEAPPPATPLSVERMEWEHIQRVLREHQGNISATARALDMHRRTLQRKLARPPGRG